MMESQKICKGGKGSEGGRWLLVDVCGKYNEGLARLEEQ